MLVLNYFFLLELTVVQKFEAEEHKVYKCLKCDFESENLSEYDEHTKFCQSDSMAPLEEKSIEETDPRLMEGRYQYLPIAIIVLD